MTLKMKTKKEDTETPPMAQEAKKKKRLGRPRKWKEPSELVVARVPRKVKKIMKSIAKTGPDESSQVAAYTIEGLEKRGHLKEDEYKDVA